VAVTSIGSSSYTNAIKPTSSFKATYTDRASIPVYATMEDKEKATLFEKFQESYGRQYKNQEERNERFVIFKNNLAQIDKRNRMQSKGAVHGITKFSDFTEAEFRGLLGYRKPDKRTGKIYPVPEYKGDSTYVDWTGTYTTAIKDQGYCGSCWAFSATEQIESDAIRAGLTTTTEALSPQQIVSCDEVDLGCDGGNTETAYAYVMTAGGITTDSQYPYTSYWDVTGQCSTDWTAVVTLSAWYDIEPDEDTMIDYVLSTGPLSVCLDASTWYSYVSGILSADSCGDDVDHCVQAVGLNEDEGYWIVRNSWGTTWGLEGFIYLELGANACDITYDPSMTVPTSV